jgi:hypothetical protein
MPHLKPRVHTCSCVLNPEP